MSGASEGREGGSWRSWHAEDLPIRVGVSACLLGEEVRYDRGNVRDRFVADVLGPWVEWAPVCPEVEIGMGVPRPPIRLVDEGGEVHLRAPSTGEDFTARMESFAERRVAEVAAEGLDGYVLKKNSPSCGMERIRVYRGDHTLHRKGVGLFADRLLSDHPGLPVEEDGRLNDPRLRENFIERIFCRNRWRNLVRGGAHRGSLVAFHTAHKLLLWSHNEAGMRRMGQLLGEAGSIPDEELYARYATELDGTMRRLPTRKRHVNVLQHAFGYFKRLLGPIEKRELLAAIEDYRLGFLPLLVPVTLIRYNARKHETGYLLDQLYFDPHPKELVLRNHA